MSQSETTLAAGSTGLRAQLGAGTPAAARRRFAVIGCSVFSREFYAAAARSPYHVDLTFLPYQLHGAGSKNMVAEIQKNLDAVPAGYDAVVLGYALCNNGIIGLTARQAPLVALRSHDCIACFLGSLERYQQEFSKAPGTYWLSIGWVERCPDASEMLANTRKEPAPDDPMWRKMLAKYGEDNARFLWDEMQNQCQHYERLAFVDTGIGPQEAAKAEAKRRSDSQGWRFEVIPGDRSWIEALLTGDWDDKRFLVVPPGQRIVAKYDGSLIGAEPIAPSPKLIT